MAIKVNLLPTEKRVGKGLQRILRVTRMLGVISLVIFILFGLGMIAFFVFNSISLGNLKTANGDLEDRITGLETSEQKIVLLKDRVGKIKSLFSIPSAINNLDSVNTVLSPLSKDTTISELNVNPTKVSMSINFKSAADIGVFLTGLKDTKSFQTVSISSFSFNPVSGYLVSIAIQGK